jgi:hypothetical protein
MEGKMGCLQYDVLRLLGVVGMVYGGGLILEMPIFPLSFID